MAETTGYGAEDGFHVLQATPQKSTRTSRRMVPRWRPMLWL